MCGNTNDQYVVFADIINKITRTNGKVQKIELSLLCTHCVTILQTKLLVFDIQSDMIF